MYSLKQHQLNKHSAGKGFELREVAVGSSLRSDPTPRSTPNISSPPQRKGKKKNRDLQILERNKRKSKKQARLIEDGGSSSDCEKNKEKSSDDDLSYHRESHSKTLSCDQCDFTSGIVAIMNRHKKSQHGELIVYPCDQCEFTADRPYRLKLHKKSEHSKVTSAKMYSQETSSKIDQVIRSYIFFLLIYKNQIML